MNQRATIVVNGRVQKVGYRDEVQDIARELDIKGYIENLRDGSIRIICEAEKDLINEFVERIHIKKDFIEVKEAKIVETSEPKNEFEYFDIKRGELVDELGERFDTGIMYMSALHNETKDMHADLKDMHVDLKDEIKDMHTDLKDEMKTGFYAVKEEVKASRQDNKERHADLTKGFHEVGQKIDNLTDHTDKNFHQLDEKYHTVSDTLIAINEHQKIMSSEFTRTREELTRVVDNLTRLIEERVGKEDKSID